MAIGQQNQQKNQQSKDDAAGFAGERITPFTRTILLLQIGMSAALSILFILNNWVTKPFLQSLTGWMSPELAVAIVLSVAGYGVIIIKHIDILIKDVKK